MKDYKWECILYPDSHSYNCDEIIAQLIDFWPEWAFIEHNKDKCDDGTFKVRHVHFLGRNPELTKFSAESLSKRFFPLKPTDFEHIKNWRVAVRYLRHLDQPDKESYSADLVCSNIWLDSYWSKPDETDQARAILSYLSDHGGIVSMSQILDYVLSNNLYGAFRRGFSIWRSYIVSDNEYCSLFKKGKL